MKNIYILIALLGVQTAISMEQPSLGTLPRELQMLVAQHLITNDLDESIKNIVNYARINKPFRELINHPQNMITLIERLVNSFRGANEVYIAQRLQNMPGIQTQEVQKWLKDHETERTLLTEINREDIKKVEELLNSGININARVGREQNTALLDAIFNWYREINTGICVENK